MTERHYASGLREKVMRGLQLGPRYYLRLPRYAWQRRARQLPALDWGAIWNPLRSFQQRSYVSWPAPPHFDEAMALLTAAGVVLDNPPWRIEALSALWWHARDARGDVIEAGAYRGATSLLLAVLGRLHGVSQRVLVLDTFEGMPSPSALDHERKRGEFAPPGGWDDTIRSQAAALGVADRVEVHKGLFADSAPAIHARGLTFAFAHVDANIYQGTLDACELVMPHMATGGAVVFDDYNGLMDLGARLAIDEYLDRPGAHRGRRPLPLAECSAFLRT